MPLLFATAAFLSASLLFCVEPMIAKMVLPQFGGSPAVWNTCLVFFQLALLAGYIYAHAASQWLGAAEPGAGSFRPPRPADRGAADRRGNGRRGRGRPGLRLLGRLVVAAGLPFFVVATTAPLLQRWFAATGHPRAGRPLFPVRGQQRGQPAGAGRVRDADRAAPDPAGPVPALGRGLRRPRGTDDRLRPGAAESAEPRASRLWTASRSMRGSGGPGRRWRLPRRACCWA